MGHEQQAIQQLRARNAEHANRQQNQAPGTDVARSAAPEAPRNRANNADTLRAARADAASTKTETARNDTSRGPSDAQLPRDPARARAATEYRALEKQYGETRQQLVDAEAKARATADRWRETPPKDAAGQPLQDRGFPLWMTAQDKADQCRQAREGLEREWEGVQAKYHAVAHPEGSIRQGPGLEDQVAARQALEQFNAGADAIKGTIATAVVVAGYGIYTMIKNGSTGPMTQDQTDTMHRIATTGASIEGTVMAAGVAAVAIATRKGANASSPASAGSKTSKADSSSKPPAGDDTPHVLRHQLLRTKTTGPKEHSRSRGYDRRSENHQKLLDGTIRQWGGPGPAPEKKDLDLGHKGTPFSRLRPGEVTTLEAQPKGENRALGSRVEKALVRKYQERSRQLGLDPHDPANPYYTRPPKKK